MVVIDQRGRVTHSNPAAEQLLQMEEEVLQGRRMSALFEDSCEHGFQQQMLQRLRVQLQKVAGQSLEQYQTLLCEAPVPVVVVERPDKIISATPPSLKVSLVNGEMGQLLGYREQALDDATILSMILKGEWDKIASMLEQGEDSCLIYKGCRWCSRSGEPIQATLCIVTVEHATGVDLVLLVKTAETLDQELLQLTPFGRLLVEQESVEHDALEFKLSSDRLLRCGNGRTIPVHVSGTLLSQREQGVETVEGAVLLFHDLSKRLRESQQQQFLAFQSGIAEMSASILHNIGNTLSGISGRVAIMANRIKELQQMNRLLLQGSEAENISQEKAQQMLAVSARGLNNIVGGEGLRGDLEEIDRSIERIDRTISVHRSASRSDMSSTRFHFISMVEEAMVLMEEVLERSAITVTTEFESGLDVYVEMPKNPAIQMVIHLLQNGVDAIQQRARDLGEWKGELRISLTPHSSGKRLFLIEDNGCGIDPAQRPHLFTQGYSTKPKGSGFGLHSVGSFVQGIGGVLEIESSGRHCGAMVKIIF